MQKYKLKCISCGKIYLQTEVEYVCPDCGYINGTLEVIYDKKILKNNFTKEKLKNNFNFTIFRYKDILPIYEDKYIQPLKVGWTPLYSFPKLAKKFLIKDFYIKDDGLNPSASYKDRASSIVVIKAQEKGKKVIACASTGNAASSLAAFSAATDLKTFIFVPESAPLAKLTQLMVYGAVIFKVKGDYDKAYDIALKVSEKFGWYNRNAAINPYLVEGKKTGALEVSEQLNWQVPDKVFVPVGDGSVISGIVKGFKELYELNFIPFIPKIIGVQSQKANSIYLTYHNYLKTGKLKVIFNKADTLADSISVGKPRDVVKAVRYLSSINGDIIEVLDKDILLSIKELAQLTGVFAEPAGAAAYAGFKYYFKNLKLKKDDRVVIFVTGNGLKDIYTVTKNLKQPYLVNNIDDVLKIVHKEDLL